MVSNIKCGTEKGGALVGWFHRHALLLPVIVMASYYIGRGLGDTLQLFYLLCGLYSLRYMDLRPYRLPVILFVLLLSLFLISVFYPDFSSRSLKYWVLYGLSGMVMVFTVGTAGAIKSEADYQCMAWITIALLVGFITELGYFYFVINEFHPATQVNGMILAALSPLVFFFTWNKRKYAGLAIALFYLFSLLFLMVADSRTELLMLLMGGTLYLAFYLKRVMLLILLAPGIVVGTLLADNLMFSSQFITIQGDLFLWLNHLSSQRLEIWGQALTHPPEHYLTGAGMHRSIEFLPQLGYVKHLHNIFIEIWYETGLLGLLSYLALIYSLLWRLPRAYHLLEGVDRKIYSALFASGIAALIGGFLDKGYLHPLARYYMLFCFSVLYIMASGKQQGKEVAL